MSKNWKLYHNLQKSYKGIILFLVLGITLVSVLTILIYTNYRDNLISLEQEQLLTIAKSTSKTIEGFIDEKLMDSTILVQSIADDYQNSVVKEEIIDFTSYALKNYFNIQNGRVYQVQYFNEKNELLFGTLPTDETLDIIDTLAYLDLSKDYKSQTIGEIYEIAPKELAFDIITPVKVEGKYRGFIRIVIKTNTIYRMYVEEIKAGSKGYASVKDSTGVLIMHPKSEDIGSNVMEARKSEFPEYDWSELQALVEIQKKKQAGTGIYHSIWYQDEVRKRIKKFSAFAPIEVGEDFWIITVSMDYREFADLTSKYLYANIIMIGFVPIVLVILFIYVLNLRKNIAYLEKEKMYINQVNDLNVELEKDIEERKLLEQALYASKERFKRLFNAGQDLTFVLTKKNDVFEIARVNDIACTQLGIDRKDLIGQDFLSLDTTINLNSINSFLLDLSRDELTTFEGVFKLVSGILTPFEISGQVFALEGQTFVMLTARDISKKKLQEEQLNKNRALLIYKFRLVAMGEMIANIAHQWRQPLGSLSLMLSNLDDAYDHDDLSDVYFKNTMKDTKEIIQKMSNIIDEFRFFFNPRQEKSNFDIYDPIRSSIDMVKDRIKIDEVEVSIENEVKSMVYGYPNQLSQVILNIVNNSLDAMNGCYRKIVIQLKESEQNIKVIISNNGDRIPDHIIDKVFDPYFTTKSNEDGTGIGLYMTKMIIESNFNGTISMFNRDNTVETEIVIPLGDQS